MDTVRGHELAGSRLVGALPSTDMVALWREVTSGIVKYGFVIEYRDLEPPRTGIFDGLRIVIAADEPGALTGIEADEVVPAGAGLVDEVRRLQREGRVVCVVGTADAAALSVADCGIGLVRGDDGVPWTGHLLGSERLDDARFLVEACRSARVASVQSVQLAAVRRPPRVVRTRKRLSVRMVMSRLTPPLG